MFNLKTATSVTLLMMALQVSAIPVASTALNTRDEAVGGGTCIQPYPEGNGFGVCFLDPDAKTTVKNAVDSVECDSSAPCDAYMKACYVRVGLPPTGVGLPAFHATC